MKAVISIDSFKGSISTFESAEAVREAFLSVYPEGEAQLFPLADGGEGTTEAICAATGGMLVSVPVTGPHGEKIRAEFGVIPRTRTAVIEMSAAAGLPLVPQEKRNPLYTTTRGVGELIRAALEKGSRRLIIGIGGSATNDGGAGMLSALGYRLLDEDGYNIPDGAIGLSRLAKIDASGALPELSECEITVASDVENPLCGELGCSAVYAPQKGAAPEDIEKMDGWLARYAELAKEVSPEADPNFPGAGAAGGLGFALKAFLGATLTSGVGLIIKETGLSEAMREADVVITGEGRLDFQTSMGKAPMGVAKEAKKYGKTVIAFSGCIGKGAEACNEGGIDAFFPITRAPMTLEAAMDVDNAYENLRATAEQAFRLYKAARGC